LNTLLLEEPLPSIDDSGSSRWSAERQKRVRREDGHELEDWFRAKEEIAIKKSRTATA
jgi:hypothetical protein